MSEVAKRLRRDRAVGLLVMVGDLLCWLSSLSIDSILGVDGFACVVIPWVGYCVGRDGLVKSTQISMMER